MSVLVCSMNAYAVTNNLPDCSQSTVQNAISSASPGDLLVCPAGSWSWSNVDITKNITLQGAGDDGSGTNIEISANGGLESPNSYSGAFRVTGFRFTGCCTSFGNYTNSMIRIHNGHDWRFDHNTVYSHSTGIGGSGGNVIHIRYNASGLIDHNNFYAETEGSNCTHGVILFSNSGTTSTSTNDQKYSFLNFDANTVLSTSGRAIYVEDNYFYNNQDCDSHNVHAGYGRHGGIAVFRHNEIHFMNIDNHGMRAEHAGYAMAIYNNTWVRDVSGIDLYLQVNIRGGTAVVYNNNVTGSTGSIGHGINLWYERATSSGSASNVTINVPGEGSIAANTSCSGNEGYICAEQPGTGQHTGSNQEDIRDPMYFWNNTNFSSFRNQTGESWIQSGRDYFLNQGAKPGYVEYTYPHPLQGGGPPPPSPDLIPNPPSIIGVN